MKAFLDDYDREILYAGNLSGHPVCVAASLLGIPEPVAQHHLRCTPLPEQLQFVVARAATDAENRVLDPGPIAAETLDPATAHPYTLYAAARHAGTAALTRAADAYDRAVAKLRAVLTAEQERAKHRAARKARINQLCSVIEDHHTAIAEARSEIVALQDGRE